MASQFVKGDLITCTPDLVAHLIAGGFVWDGDKVQNATWLMCQQLGFLHSRVRLKAYRYAFRKDAAPEEKKPFWVRAQEQKSPSAAFARGYALASISVDVGAQATCAEAKAAGGPDFMAGEGTDESPDFHRGWDSAVLKARGA